MLDNVLQARASIAEREHFDRLVNNQGESWWGNATPAGIWRLQRRASLIASELAQFTDPLVLEIGCGVGTFTRYVLEELPLLRLVGCDVSPRSIEAARHHNSRNRRAIFEVGDVAALKYSDETFDAVIGNSVLHHLPLELSFAEIFRVLKVGGLIWFSEPNMMNPQNALERNVRFIGRMLQNSENETAFIRWRLARKMVECGFRDVSVQPYDFLHPAIPRAMVRPVDRLARFLETVPVFREVSGSLLIRGCR